MNEALITIFAVGLFAGFFLWAIKTWLEQTLRNMDDSDPSDF